MSVASRRLEASEIWYSRGVRQRSIRRSVVFRRSIAGRPPHPDSTELVAGQPFPRRGGREMEYALTPGSLRSLHPANVHSSSRIGQIWRPGGATQLGDLARLGER